MWCAWRASVTSVTSVVNIHHVRQMRERCRGMIRPPPKHHRPFHDCLLHHREHGGHGGSPGRVPSRPLVENFFWLFVFKWLFSVVNETDGSPAVGVYGQPYR